MRLGGPVFAKFSTAGEWALQVKHAGYRAAYCPLGVDAGDEQVREYADAAAKADIIIAEVGAWSNPLSPDEATRKVALDNCINSLQLAERIGARCCVNISGSRGGKWDGPCAADLTDETFDMIVGMVRGIVDSVKPQRTFYTLETMPWMYPDSADSYLRLVRAIDRKAFAVHFDPVNLVCSPQLYFRNGGIIRDFVNRLGGQIKSCHAKDILLREQLTVHLDEVRPGLGGLDYCSCLKALAGLDKDMPLMLEHLAGAEQYEAAAAHIRQVAVKEGVAI